jgi:hypothetical protein
MTAQLHAGQKVKIVGSRFDGSVGRVEIEPFNRPDGQLAVGIRVWRKGPGVIMSRGETCVVLASCVEPAK